MDTRAHELAEWCGLQLQCPPPALQMVSGDASFRRYFRLQTASGPMIAMDAPPQKEDSQSFVSVAQTWRRLGVQVPHIHASDLALGFLLLEDFGDRQLLTQVQAVDPQARDQWYRQAIRQLVHLQQHTMDEAAQLPPYDAALLDREMDLFRDWLVARKLGMQLDAETHRMVEDVFDFLRQRALSQARVAVHRDYHSRNLMCLPDQSLGILDFQDAVYGPLTYDLVSLLRDCYVRWPAEQVMQWCRYYHACATEAGLPLADFDAFFADFECMGMQRHLKASGIFARLALRDGKLGYLQDVPNTLRYLCDAAMHYAETRTFADWLQEQVLPATRGMETACAP